MAILAGCQPGSSAIDDPPKSKPKDEVKPDEPAERPIEPPMEALLLTFLLRRYPSEHFDDQALRGIFGDLRADAARGRILSEFPLKNSDEPAFVFKAYRRAE